MMPLRLNSLQINEIEMEFERSLREANARGTIEEFLKDHNINYDFSESFEYDRSRVRILIVGDSMIKKDKIASIARSIGIDEKRIDYLLDYESIKSFRFSNLQYSYKYSDVIFGPMPHSVVDKGSFSSIISRMENEDGWPNPIRSSANDSLKFTQNSITNALMETEFFKKDLSKYE